MLISHGLCWSRSAESSIPFPRKRWPRRNTTHGTRPLWLPAGADPILEISLIISYGIKPGTPQALWDTPMQDATAGNAGQSQAPGTAPYTPCKEWSILFQHHIRELFALSSQSSCSPGLVLQRFPLALPSINNNLFSSSSHTSKNWSCLLNFFSDHSYCTHYFIPLHKAQLTMPVPPTLKMSRVPRDWQQSWNHRTISLEKTVKTIKSSCQHSTAKSTI